MLLFHLVIHSAILCINLTEHKLKLESLPLNRCLCIRDFTYLYYKIRLLQKNKSNFSFNWNLQPIFANCPHIGRRCRGAYRPRDLPHSNTAPWIYIAKIFAFLSEYAMQGAQVSRKSSPALQIPIMNTLLLCALPFDHSAPTYASEVEESSFLWLVAWAFSHFVPAGVECVWANG